MERGEADGGAGDVDNGVDCADFVKMHLIEWHIVDGGFGLAEELEGAKGERASVGGERRMVEDLADRGQIAPVHMGVAWRVFVIAIVAMRVVV